MDREIKFRVWRYDQNRMFNNDWLLSGNIQYDALFDKNRKDIIVMQFTGLKDKNGVEIYEHDVVKRLCETDDSKGGGYRKGAEIYTTPVIYSASSCAFVQRKGFDFKIEKYMDLEVLGNIYQHPELLKQEQPHEH